MRYCPHCLGEFEASAETCPVDGTPLRSSTPSATHLDGEDDAFARLRSHGIGVHADDNYDRFLGAELGGRYRISRKLGEGGMAVVFLATDTSEGHAVAIKILRQTVSEDQDAVLRFLREATAAASLRHPHLARVSDTGTTDDGLAYQVMEYVEGPTLAEYLRENKRIAPADAIVIIEQIGDALAVVHDKGIVHRDLKPENIFLASGREQRYFVKVVDFGTAISSAFDEPRMTNKRFMTSTGVIFGTPEYMSPEQASGAAEIDHRADIYSLGVILYEMITGRVPLSDPSVTRTLSLVILEPPPPMRKIAPDLAIRDELEGVIMKALAKKADARWASAREFILALRDAC